MFSHRMFDYATFAEDELTKLWARSQVFRKGKFLFKSSELDLWQELKSMVEGIFILFLAEFWIRGEFRINYNMLFGPFGLVVAPRQAHFALIDLLLLPQFALIDYLRFAFVYSSTNCCTTK